MSSSKCARCELTVYPVEGLRCLDKVWHKGCFKCHECNMTLNMKNYKGFDKMPYCNAHCPQAKATTVADTPEIRRLAENTRIQSQAKYHEDFEKSKGKGFTAIADDPETLRIKNTSKIISNVAYHGELERKKQMEERRTLSGPEDDIHNASSLSGSSSNGKNHNRNSTGSSTSTPSKNHTEAVDYQSQQHNHQANNFPPPQVQYQQQQQQQYQMHNQQQQILQQQKQQHMHYSIDHNGQQQMVNQHQQQAQHLDRQMQQPPVSSQQLPPGHPNYNQQQQRQQQQMLMMRQQQQQQMIMMQQQQQQQRQSMESNIHNNMNRPVPKILSNHLQPQQQQLIKRQLIPNPNQQQQTKYGAMNVDGSALHHHHNVLGPQQQQHVHHVNNQSQHHHVNGMQNGPQRIPPNATIINGPQGPQVIHGYSQQQMIGASQQSLQQQQQQFVNRGQIIHPGQIQQTNNNYNQMRPQPQQVLRHQQQQPQQVYRPVFRAMYDYVANDVDEVSFFENDILIDCVNVDGNWLIGKVARSGHSGMLPANYVTEMPSHLVP